MKLSEGTQKLLKSTLISGLAKAILLCLLEGDSNIRMLSRELGVGPERIREGLKELANLGILRSSALNTVPTRSRTVDLTGDEAS